MARLRAGVSTVIVGDAGVGKTALAGEVRATLRARGQATLWVSCGDWGGAAVPTTTADVMAAAAVIVDDAHLLDTQSAQLLADLVRAARSPVVATARSGDKPLHSLGWLWAGAAERLELQPLVGEDVHLLVERQLGGEVDDQLAQMLTDRTRGNPLLVRELVQAGVRSGSLTLQQGAWRLFGDLPLTSPVVDMIRATLASLGEEELQTLQMLALAQPVPLPVAERIAAPTILEELESRHLVVVGTHGGAPALSCAHPLYAEVLRSDLGDLRSRRLRRQLLQAMGADSSLPDRERLLAVSWRLELGDTVGTDELLTCSRIATTSNPALAERLLRAALERDAADLRAPGSIAAATMLAQLLVIQGRVAEADHVINQMNEDAGAGGLSGATQQQREQLATARVLVRTRLGEITEALRLVGAAPDAGPDQPASLQTQALYAQLMLLTARLDEALTITGPILANPTDDQVARGIAAYTVVAAHSFTGRTDATEHAMQRAIPILDVARDQLPYGAALAQVSTAISQVLAGRFSAAARLGQRMHDTAHHQDDPWLRPRSATVLGLLALYRGEAQIATAHLRSAVATLTPLDAMFVRYNLAFLARAAALTGNLAEAQQALQPPADAPVFPLYEADWQIAEAAVLAAQHRLDDAARQAMAAARTAAGHGQWGIAATAAHDATRYSDTPDAAPFLTTVADLVDGPLPSIMRDHAIARTAHDPALLHAVSMEFERLGATLFAAEAAYASAHDLHRLVNHAAASERAARATELHSRCGHVYAPWTMGRAAKDLTTRERQVALLAAAGHPDRHMSTQLGISIRTVQTHLTHAYTKLHVQTRKELPAALAGD